MIDGGFKVLNRHSTSLTVQCTLLTTFSLDFKYLKSGVRITKQLFIYAVFLSFIQTPLLCNQEYLSGCVAPVGTMWMDDYTVKSCRSSHVLIEVVEL